MMPERSSCSMNDFSDEYHHRSDEELLQLWVERSQLASEARRALQSEIHKRSLTREAESATDVWLYRLSVSWLLRLTAIWVFPFRGSGYESYGCASEVGMAFRLRRRSNLVVKPDNPFARQPGPSCDIPTLMRANGIRAVQSVILYLAKELRTPSPLTTNPAT